MAGAFQNDADRAVADVPVIPVRMVRLDRVLEIPEHGIRREGAVMPRDGFDRVADALRRDYGWR